MTHNINSMIYLTFGLGLLLAGGFLKVEGKCSLAPLDAARIEERTIAYVCIHGNLSDLNEIPVETVWIEFTVARLNLIPADAFSKFNYLQRLTFYNCEVREIHPDAFRGLINLEWLVFSNTKLNVAKTSMFNNIPNLKMLTLDSTGLIYIEPEVFKLLGNKLEILSVRNNDLDCLPIDALTSMKHLKTIRIDQNPWMCDCRRELLNYFESRKINQGSFVHELNYHNRRKRWYKNYYNETYSSSRQSSTRVYDCMAVLDYPALPPVQLQAQQPNYDYSYHQRIEWREATANSIAYLDRLPDAIGWIELYDLRIPTIHRYTFFRFGNTLRSITLKNCGVEFIEGEAFAGLHKLERLTIIGARLSTVSNWFRDLTRLTDLILERDSIERFEHGALDHLRNLRRLNLRGNRLNCLPHDNLEGIASLERLEAAENPWMCSCRRDLESYLIGKRIGYEISNSRADGTGCIDDNDSIAIIRPTYEYQNFYNITSSGRIRWSWGYETRAQKPNRPTTTTTTPQPPVIHETKPLVITHQGGCRQVSPQHYHHHHRFNHLKGLTYVCTRSTLDDIKEIPSTIETIIFTNSIIHTLHSDVFRKFNGFLRRLEFRDCEIQSIDERAFAGLHHLEDLVINDNDIEVVRSEWFREMKNLRHLNLARNNIGRVNNGVFDMLPYLTSIDISDNILNCIGIEHLEKLKHLREINVVGNPWTCLCATRLAGFIDERNIYCENDCLNSVLQDDGESSWGGCHSTGNKRPRPRTTVRPSTSTSTSMPPMYPHIPPPAGYTNISGTCSSTHEHTHYHCSNGDIFLTSNIPSHVRSIEIYDSFIPHLPAASFARFENLTELILRNCSLRDIDPRAFRGLYKLEKLIIRDNRFSVIRNTWFKDCGNFYWLDLSKNNLAEIETGALDNLKQLQYLNLEDNVFECIYTTCFVHLPRLDTLEFSRNPLKWRCWQDLRQFLEIRAVGYTYYKCPHDSRDLIKNLQSSENNAHASAPINDINIVGYFILSAILILIYDK
ncbi:hypothetical protein PV328_000875 [Microctonus aethiopoides]|uniref:Uncharacterized protein n=1 Tax=Microctonus aethiopoides TaxID=144406 RepID=A0AA39KWX2_9HYME|nr:hypothetical protein PV328_000875 [Microctonus aethiopoides]